jgi:MFS family permease
VAKLSDADAGVIKGNQNVTFRAPAVATSAVVMALLPLMAAVLVVFRITGLAIPVLPLHVHQGLGLGTFVVGLVTGIQFAASLVSRIWSGRYADSRGAKRAVVVGLVAAAASGLLYLLWLRSVFFIRPRVRRSFRGNERTVKRPE